MKRMHVVGLCLAAVFALSAVLVAGASAALPEYKDCAKTSKNPVTKKYEGKYSVKTCATEATVAEQEEGKHNKYERKAWNEGKNPAPSFKGKNIGSPHNNIVDPTCPEGQFNNGTHKCNVTTGAAPNEKAQIAGTTTCSKEKVEGKITGPKTETWVTHFGKCEALETPCNTKGAPKAGEIITDELESTLVYLEGTTPGIRVKGNGTGAKPNRLAQYECLSGALNVEVYSEILAEATGNVNSAEKSVLAKAVEGPLALQSNVYENNPFGATDEEKAKAFFNWGAKFQACVKEEIEKGKTQAEAEAACFGKVGPPPAPKPIMLESVTTLGAGPAVQNGETANKGDKEILVEA
jgi:hypothetical protein